MTIDVSEVDWCVEPRSDAPSEGHTEFNCNECGAFFYAHIHNSPAGFTVSLDEHPDVEISADDARYNSEEVEEVSWLNHDFPKDSFHEFRDSQKDMKEVLSRYDSDIRCLQNSTKVINRMVFSGAISAMEAYLSSTVISLVTEEPDSMERLLKKDRQLSSEKVTLHEVFRDHCLVEDRVKNYLSRVLYHNLGRVEEIYRICFEVEVFPSEGLKERLHRAIELRHDIVHRNGKDSEGKDQDYSTELVLRTMEDVDELITHIQTAVFGSATSHPAGG